MEYIDMDIEIDRDEDQREKNDALTEDLKNDIKYDKDLTNLDKEYDIRQEDKAEKLARDMGGDKEKEVEVRNSEKMFIGKGDKDFERDELQSLTDQKLK